MGYHKHIIGKGGSTINKIKSETDATINIPDTDSGVTIIRIEGNKAGVDKASKELNGMVEKIRKDFANVQISFPDLGVKSDIVKLRGPKKDVDECSRHFTKLAKEMAESSYQVKVPIFKQFHKFVIGKGGANIRRIRDETDTKIDLPD